ncbi:saccharopine dehydrogenase NADP-binding domain-containing protein [Nocardia araoensis]|uniref:saccharopine dehydrogenase NADP-binding domain-containing protein n=1 Tax=Nocardia araoensis TaxID=228600 RepID=UPI0002E23534|nr:saccharopine dehydrogenase NADP-binding domain-containing protein [Nocardia araoensis]
MTIAVYGASGHTGKLVLAELRRRGVEPVLVGRDADRLRAAAAETGLPDAVIRVAELGDAPLTDAFRGVRVVISTVAPFREFGEPVVRAAIAAGAHYVDTSGEQTHVERVFDAYAEPARQAGVTVVPMVNDGGFLGDLVSSLAAARVERPEQVTLAHRHTGGAVISRGSGRTAIANADAFTSGGPIFTDGAWRTDLPARTTELTFPGTVRPVQVVKFALTEVITVPRHVPADHVEGVAETEVAALFADLTPELAETLPEFPEDDPGNPGRFLVLADVTGPGGSARAYAEGADTYRFTAIAAADAAVRLATGGAEAGVLAPSQAFDPADVLNSFAAQGIRWSVEPRP